MIPKLAIITDLGQRSLDLVSNRGEDDISA